MDPTDPALTGLMMDFSISSILAGLVFGVFGIYVLKLGKQKADYRIILAGLFLMFYTYFVSNPFLTWAIGGGTLYWVYTIR